MNTTPYKPLNKLLFDVYIVLYHADTELRCDRLIFNELQKKKKNQKKRNFIIPLIFQILAYAWKSVLQTLEPLQANLRNF